MRPTTGRAPAQAGDAALAARMIWHPYFVVRIGGEPIQAMRSLSSLSAARAHDNAGALRRRLKQDLASLCSDIEKLVPAAPDKKQQRDLINVKRDLFNLRAPKPAAIESIHEVIDNELRGRLVAALNEVDRLHALEKQAAGAYEADLVADAAALREVTALPNMRAALAVGSPTLFQSLRKLEAGAPLRRKDWSNLNLAISSFLTRATLKTSPKSSLTLVALGAWGAAGPSAIDFALDRIALRRTALMRNSLIERVFRPLIDNVEKLAPTAFFVPNPTIRLGSDRIEWQRIAYSEAMEMETYGVSSTTNRLPAKPGLLTIFRDWMSSGAGSTIADLTGYLHSAAGLKSHDDAQLLVARLVALELLVLADTVPAQHDRILWARSIARVTEPGLRSALEAGLDRLEMAQQALTTSGDSGTAGGEIEQALDELAILTGASIRSAQCRPVFHEDCIIASPAVQVRGESADDLRDDMLDLAMLLPLLRGFGWATAWLIEQFVTRFGPGGRCADPAAFLAETAETLASPSENASAVLPWHGGKVPDDEDALAQDAIASAFLEELRAHNADSDSWTIPSSLIERFYHELPSTYRGRARSHCVNGQFISTGDEPGFVVNSVYPGNGRMTSRFLDEPGPVVDYVAKLAPGIPVAIPGVFGFNANRHKPLSDHELSIPLYPADYAETRKHTLAGCTLRHDLERNRLILENNEGRELSPIYFGILNSWALPPVHRLLDWLNGAADLPFSIAGAIFARGRPAVTPPIWTQPRLKLGKLILARQAYSVAVDVLPDPTMPEDEFFFALREFWNEGGLPRMTFFRAANVWQEGSAKSRRPHKTRKPMYLDIDNVWLVKAFQRALRAIKGRVSFSEALPLPGDSPLTIDGKRHAVEITLEFGVKAADV